MNDIQKVYFPALVLLAFNCIQMKLGAAAASAEPASLIYQRECKPNLCLILYLLNSSHLLLLVYCYALTLLSIYRST